VAVRPKGVRARSFAAALLSVIGLSAAFAPGIASAKPSHNPPGPGAWGGQAHPHPHKITLPSPLGAAAWDGLAGDLDRLLEHFEGGPGRHQP
jgi:hypothetical protein